MISRAMRFIGPYSIAFPLIHLLTRFLADIGANLTDAVFRGVYREVTKHPDDFEMILARSRTVGLEKILITVGTLADLEAAVSLAKSHPGQLFTTLGIHPTHCGEFLGDPEGHFLSICEHLELYKDHIVALGELGLDYDRLNFCEKDVQLKYFEKQLDLCSKYNLPLFLHSRSAHSDFVEILRRNMDKIKRSGVVHSFTGTWEEAEELIQLGFSIGINGCSLKTEENLEVVKRIPLDKLMIETDAPWCGIRPSHAGAKLVETKFPTVKKKEKWTKDSLVDGRNEPCQIM